MIIYMGNVLSKLKVSMEITLKRVRQKLNRDERAHQIYKEIHQEDPMVEIDNRSVVYL
jgi:hypothetical protein